MPDRSIERDKFADLRRRAEELAAGRRPAPDFNTEDLQRLIYEINVHQIELEMQNEELKLRASLLDTASDAILVRKNGEGISYVNEAAVKLYGYSREELMGKTVYDLMPPEEYAGYEDRNKNILQQQGAIRTETVHRRKDGTLIPVEIHATLNKLEGKEYVMTSVRDITRRKHNEEELGLRARLLDSASDAIMLRRPDGQFIYINEAASRLYGYSRDEFSKLTILDLVTPETMPAYYANIRRLMAGGENRLETVHIRKDKTRVPVEIYATLIRSENGDYILSVNRDISDRKRAEEELKLRALLLDSATDAILLRNLDNRFIYANEAATKLYGYSHDEFLKMNFRDLVLPQNLPLFEKAQKEIREKGEIRVEVLHRRKDGSPVPVEAQATVVRTGAGNYIMSVAHDITERKKIKESLMASEEKFRSVIEQSTEGFILIDGKGIIQEWNREQERITGLKRDKVIGRPIWDMQYETMRPERKTAENFNRIKSLILELLETGKAPWLNTPRAQSIQRPDGKIRTIESITFPIKTVAGEMYGNIIRDITERKTAEEALKRSEEKYRTLVQNAPVGIAVNTLDGKPVERNAASMKMHGYENLEEFNKVPVVDLYLDPEDRKRFLAAVARGAVRDFEVRHKRKDGSAFWMSMTAIPTMGEHGEKQTIVISQDITERKAAEEALKRSEARYRRLVQNAPVAIAINTLDGRPIERNLTSATMHGYDSIEELEKIPPDGLYFEPEDRKNFLTAVRKGIVRDFETRHKRKDGSLFWVAMTAIPVVTAEGEKEIIIVTEDIDDRKKAEDALRQSEEKFRRLVEHAPVGIAIVTLDGRPILRNRAVAEQSGFSEEEMVTLPVAARYYDPEDRNRFLDQVKKGIVRNFEVRLMRKDRSCYWASLTSVPIKTELGDGLLTIMEDITDRKLVERDLKESEEKYRRIVETANEGISISEPNGRITFVNQRLADMLGYSRDEITGKMVIDLFDKDQVDSVLRARDELEQGKNVKVEMKFTRKDGEILWALASIAPLYDSTGKHIGNLSMHTDITDRKRDEEEMRQTPLKLVQAQEKERRAIGRELHDQTGQYLTALKLLLGNARKLPAERVAPVLEDAYGMTDELLKQVRELSLSLRPPMLDDLGLLAALLWQFERITTSTGVAVSFKHSGIKKKLPADVATAAFRIVQEALTNAIRYSGAGKVNVSVRAAKNLLRIRVEDRGRGFELDGVRAGTSSGLTNMRERALMLNGKLTIDSHPGTGTTIVAEIPIYIEPVPEGKREEKK